MKNTNQDKPSTADKIAGVLIILLLVIAIVIGYVKGKDIDDNRIQTTGTIVKITHERKSRYSLEYSYYVNGKKYKGNVLVNYFECNKKNKCIGHKIDVHYSTENHGNSQAYLDKYDKYRTQVYFY